MVRHILANPSIRGWGRAILIKHPKFRPYFVRLSKRFGLVNQSRILKKPIFQAESLQDLSPRAMEIYRELRKHNSQRER